jgi:hypothetical protein
MSDLDPGRFTHSQVDRAREDYAQLLKELELAKERSWRGFTPGSICRIQLL